MKAPIISCQNVQKNYTMGDTIIHAVRDVSFSVYPGEFILLLGASGAGKTTLLYLLAGIERPTSGSIFVDNSDITTYTDSELTAYRGQKIGFVFQFYNLIQNLTALENVALATDLAQSSLHPETIIEQVGLYNRLHNFPSQLSGGEQQRIAIARAISKDPLLLLCDEPTGALDEKTGTQILELLRSINQTYKKTIVLITHNEAFTTYCDRVLRMHDGTIMQEG